MNLRQEKGITLIALVITIIVMLILVAVTVSVAVNGGLFNYAKNAGRETRFAVLEEQLYSAYMEDIMADHANGTDNANFANAIAKLNLNGEYVKPITSSGVADIVLNPDITTTAIVIGTDDETKTATFTATPEDEDETTNYYVVEDGQYYKINYNGNGLVKIDTNPSDVNTNDNTLSIIVADETIATGSITGNTVTITGTKTVGNTTFKVKCGSVEKNGTINAIAPVSETYGEIGDRVFLVSTSTEENPATIAVKGTNTIEDNWKVFYEDEDFVYLIYGDYYPVSVQTDTGANVIFASGTSTEAVTGLSRENLLTYLRNNSAYTWNTSSPYGENHGTNGTTYTSWNDLKTALNATAKLTRKTITIQGSPDIELWVKSWNAKNNVELTTVKTSDGYQIGLSSGTPDNYVQLGSYNTVEGKGYNDTLYFPYKTEQTTGQGYWLACPNARTSDCVGRVNYNGVVYGNNYLDTNFCARPVVIIEK